MRAPYTFSSPGHREAAYNIREYLRNRTVPYHVYADGRFRITVSRPAIDNMGLQLVGLYTAGVDLQQLTEDIRSTRLQCWPSHASREKAASVEVEAAKVD